MSRRAVQVDHLPYLRDSRDMFEKIRDLPGAVLLDSSFPRSTAGRYDIMAALPAETLPTLPAAANEAQCQGFFEAIRDFHRERYAGTQPVSQDIPFCGGILGYIGYEAGLGLNRVRSAAGAAGAPAVWLQAYDWCVLQDHLLRRAALVTQPTVPAALHSDLRARLLAQPPPVTAQFRLDRAFSSNFTPQSYRAAFDRVATYIRAGDCYQVNLAQRFSAPFSGDPWNAYRTLRDIAAAPFSAFLSLPDDTAVISLSPERFLSLLGHHVETAPIKGTRPRDPDPRADRQIVRGLRGSEKDRAENLMIVDLLRNDLGRSCVPGSIHVDRLFEVHSLPTVHHLVSTISGELRADRGAVELLRDSFPGGSITGAPKRRAMEIIAELEPDPRQVYCGSILYISADGRMDSNIAIRTLLCHQGEVHCWAGGGIVADSAWEQEYQETFDKVGRFLTELERGEPR